MTKKFSLEIKSPCDANIKDMKPNASGFFCDSCTKNVIDLSTKTNSEIAAFISKQKNKTNICARLKTSQLEEEFQYNEFSKTTNLKYAVAVAASVLLTSPIIAQENNLPLTTITTPQPHREIMGKIAYTKPVSKVISFVFEGKLLDVLTKKPLDEKKFPAMNMFISGGTKHVIINPKNGNFSIPLTLDEKVNELYISISTGDLYYTKIIKIDRSKITNSILKQNLLVNPKEFSIMHIAGGLGVNYIDSKKSKS